MSTPPDASTTEIVPDRDRPNAYLVRVGGADQSHVDLDDPTHVEFPYVRRIADLVDVVTVPHRMRVIHIGGAGLTLARYAAVTRPGTAQVVLEPDERLTERVRETLPLPRRSGIKVRGVDGRSGVAAMPDDYADVVVVDAFVGAQVPADLVTTQFFTDVRRVLRSGGIMAMNVPDGAPFRWSGRVIAGARSMFDNVVVTAEPATLKGRRRGNVLVVASPTELPWREVAHRAARQAFPYRVLDPTQVVARFGDATPFSDENSETSPAPPAAPAHFG